AKHSLDHRSLQKPAGLLLGRGQSLDVLPCHMIDSGGPGGFDRRFTAADDCKKVAIAHELNGPLGCAAYGILIDRTDCGATVGLADDACVHHAVEMHVVNEGMRAEDLLRQIDAGAARTDTPEVGDALALAATGRLDVEIHCAGKSPIVLPGRCPVAKNAAVADGQFTDLATKDLRCLIEK